MNKAETFTPNLIWRDFTQYFHLNIEEIFLDNILLSNAEDLTYQVATSFLLERK